MYGPIKLRHRCIVTCTSLAFVEFYFLPVLKRHVWVSSWPVLNRVCVSIFATIWAATAHFFLKKRIRQTLMFLCRHFWDICQTTNIFSVVLIEENKTKNKQANKTCTRHQRTKKTKTKQKKRTFSYFVTACSKYKNWGLKRILNKKEKKHNVNDY